MISRDFKRIKRLGKYLRKDKKRLGVILLIMLPVAIAGAVQPLLVGQAISVLKGEPTFSLINELSMKDSIRFLVGVDKILHYLNLKIQI